MIPSSGARQAPAAESWMPQRLAPAVLCCRPATDTAPVLASIIGSTQMKHPWIRQARISNRRTSNRHSLRYAIDLRVALPESLPLAGTIPNT